jgi:hypothetical protein
VIAFRNPTHLSNSPNLEPCDSREMVQKTLDAVEKTLKTVFAVVLGIVTVGFVVGISVLVYFMTRPRGEAVGRTNLREGNVEVAVTGNAGDSLHFRSDVSIVSTDLGTLGDDQRERKVQRLLRESTLTLKAISASGAERTASCPIYNGRSGTTTVLPSTYSMSGMLNDCVIPLDAAGAWKVRSSVAWASGLPLRTATLEVRLEAAQK